MASLNTRRSIRLLSRRTAETFVGGIWESQRTIADENEMGRGGLHSDNSANYRLKAALYSMMQLVIEKITKDSFVASRVLCGHSDSVLCGHSDSVLCGHSDIATSTKN